MGSKFSKKVPSKALTEVELEMMNIIWSLESCTVHQILEHLPKNRHLAYTSVSTIVRILEQKKYLRSEKEGRGHVYFPCFKKEDYQHKSIDHMVKNVFDGAPLSLVRQLLQSESLTQKDLAELKSMLSKRG